MSGVPTSGREGHEPEVLARAGWRNAELIWEQIQEAVARARGLGDPDDAGDLAAGALEVAREHLAENDPRLATSLVNLALSRRGAGDEEAAEQLAEAALGTWQRSRDWIATLRPERRARSSLFHMRLEAKHPGGYDGPSRQRYEQLAREGESVIREVMGGAGPDGARWSRWQQEKPAGYTDSRKLLAAVLLMATVAS